MKLQLALLCLIAPTLAAAQERKLSGPLVLGPGGGSVGGDLALGPAGEQVAFRSRNHDGYSVYLAPTDGSGPLPIEDSLGVQYGFLPSGALIYSFEGNLWKIVNGVQVSLLDSNTEGTLEGHEVSPDATTIGFVSQVDGVDSLWTVPADGSAPPTYLAPYAGSSFFTGLDFTPDGTRILSSPPDVTDYATIPVDGSGPPVLLGIVQPGVVGGLGTIVPVEDRVVFERRDFGANTRTLWSVPQDGSADPYPITPPIPDTERYGSFLPVPGSPRLVYQAGPLSTSAGASQRALFSVPVDGSAPPVQLMSLGSGGRLEDALVTPDGTHVIYRVRSESQAATELYSVPVEGGAIHRLSPPLIQNGNIRELPEVSSDGSFVVFRAQSDSGSYELFRSPVDGSSPPYKLHPLFTEGERVEFIRLAPDDSRVAFLLDRPFPGTQEAFSVPAAGGTLRRLNEDLVPGGEIWSLRYADGGRVLFLGDTLVEGKTELYAIEDLPGAAPTRINVGTTSPEPVGSISASTVSPDGAWALYSGSQDDAAVHALYSVPLNRIAQPRRLSPPGNSSSTFRSRITPDSRRVVFVATDPVLGSRLFSVPIGGGTAVQLSPPGERADGLILVSGDSAKVVFSTDERIYHVPVEGGPAVLLTSAIPGEDIFEETLSEPALITQDSTRVCYAEETAPQTRELFSVPFDGSEPPTRLHPPHAPYTTFRSVREAGGRVLFIGWISGAGTRLVSTPADGSGPAVALDDPGSLGNVADYRFEEGGETILYWTWSDYLYRAAADGSSPPEGLLPVGGRAREPRVSPSGRFLAFSTGSQLFSLPIAGGTPLLLSTPGAGSTGSDDWEFLADDRILFRERSGPLKSRPLDGSLPAVILQESWESTDTRGVGKVTPDGKTVLIPFRESFRATLHALSHDGSRPGRIVGRSIGNASDFNLRSFWPAPDSNRVLYLSELLAPDHFELFLHSLRGQELRASRR